jgi:hypothetical protein
VDDRGDLRRGVRLHEAQVELDHLGGEEGHEGERPAVRADVVQGDGTAELPQPGHGGEDVPGAVGERALRELEDDVELAHPLLQDPLGPLGRRRLDHARLHVEEEAERLGQPRLERAADGRHAAAPLELDEPARLARGGEEPVRALEGRALGAPRERLEGDDEAGVDVNDGLVDAAQRPLGQDAVELGRRPVGQQGRGGGRRRGPVRGERGTSPCQP